MQDKRTAAAPVLKDIVLVGGGHSHAVALRAWAMRPVPGVRLTLICTDTHTPYSGMLPGYIAGHYGYDEVHLDLRRLATFAGARYFHDEVIGLDREARLVLCRHRPPVPYDLLSINTGSTPQVQRVPGASEPLSVTRTRRPSPAASASSIVASLRMGLPRTATVTFSGGICSTRRRSKTISPALSAR